MEVNKMANWKSSDKVTFVIKREKNRDGLHKAYVVFGDSKDQLRSAIAWAGTGYKIIDNIENKGFTLQIYNAAGGSSQGGKLSFWMCIIGNIPNKEIDKVLIGISSSILAELIKNSEFSRGVCKQQVILASYAGQTCAIHNKMESYKQLKEDEKSRAELKSKRTELIQGGLYRALDKEDVYLCRVKKYFSIKNNFGSGTRENPIEIIVNRKPKLSYLMVAKYVLDSCRRDIIAENGMDVNSTTELLMRLANRVQEVYRRDNLDNLARNSSYYNTATWLFNDSYILKSKPKRFESGMYIGKGNEGNLEKSIETLRRNIIHNYLDIKAIHTREYNEGKNRREMRLWVGNLDSCVDTVGAVIGEAELNIEKAKCLIIEYVKACGFTEEYIKFVEN